MLCLSAILVSILSSIDLVVNQRVSDPAVAASITTPDFADPPLHHFDRLDLMFGRECSISRMVCTWQRRAGKHRSCRPRRSHRTV